VNEQAGDAEPKTCTTALEAFLQLLSSGKSSEVWFSLRENHVKA
jgi:hypothetical protein